jgi:hypothetical protein
MHFTPRKTKTVKPKPIKRHWYTLVCKVNTSPNCKKTMTIYQEPQHGDDKKEQVKRGICEHCKFEEIE